MLMTRVSPVLVAAGILCLQSSGTAAPSGKAQNVSAQPVSQVIQVKIAGKTFTWYKFLTDQKYPYLFPVLGPLGGDSLTTETSDPYPHHHSLFFGCDKVSGGNYWHGANEVGQISSKGPKIIQAKGKRVVIEDHTRWHRRGAPDPFTDTRQIIISAPSPTLRFIDFTITLTALSDVQIAKTNHSLFCARMAPRMNVQNGGRLVNAEGKLSQKGTLAAKSNWCDYSNKVNGKTQGLAILVWPKNRWSPCTWLTRDYGFFSPTPMNWLGPEGLRFKKGESLTLKFRVVVHAGNEKDADIAGIYKDWIKSGGADR